MKIFFCHVFALLGLLTVLPSAADAALLEMFPRGKHGDGATQALARKDGVLRSRRGPPAQH